MEYFLIGWVVVGAVFMGLVFLTKPHTWHDMQ